MKILHVTETLKGGVATVVVAISQEDKVNHSLYGPDEHCGSVSGFKGKFYSFVRKGRSLTSLLSFVVKFPSVFFSVRPDVIHFHSSFSLLLSPIARFFSIFGPRIRIVYQPHGVSYDSDIPRSKFNKFILEYVERFLVVFVDLIIVISNHELGEVSRVHPNKDVVIIYNGVRETLIFGEDIPRDGFLFVGRFDDQKGIDLLIDFWNTTGQTEILNLVGESVVGAFEIGISQNIKVHGWLNPEELDSMYASSKALIVPSRWEGFGLVVIEAYRNSTPVIVSNKGALPELVVEGETGFIIDMDNFNSSLSNKLFDFSKSDFAILGKNSRNRYVSEFSEREFLEKILNVYCGDKMA